MTGTYIPHCAPGMEAMIDHGIIYCENCSTVMLRSVCEFLSKS